MTELKRDDLGYPGEDFLRETKSDLVIKFKHSGFHFASDEESRDIYECSLNGFNFDFGQSLALSATLDKPGTPPAKDEVLSCLEVDCHENFHDFCDEYGYDPADRKSAEIHEKVLAQVTALRGMFDEQQLQMLREVQG